MLDITEKQQERYLEDPNTCPFCNGRELSAGDTDFSDADAWRNIECTSCGRKWLECFQLWSIENLEEPDIWDGPEPLMVNEGENRYEKAPM